MGLEGPIWRTPCRLGTKAIRCIRVPGPTPDRPRGGFQFPAAAAAPLVHWREAVAAHVGAVLVVLHTVQQRGRRPAAVARGAPAGPWTWPRPPGLPLPDRAHQPGGRPWRRPVARAVRRGRRLHFTRSWPAPRRAGVRPQAAARSPVVCGGTCAGVPLRRIGHRGDRHARSNGAGVGGVTASPTSPYCRGGWTLRLDPSAGLCRPSKMKIVFPETTGVIPPLGSPRRCVGQLHGGEVGSQQIASG